MTTSTNSPVNVNHASRDAAPSEGSKKIRKSIPIGGVIFDLDGTLIDYETVSHIALETPLIKAGILKKEEGGLSWSIHGSIVGMRNEDWSKSILSQLGVDPERYSYQQYMSDYESLVPELTSQILTWPNVEHLLRYFRDDLQVPICIATSSPRSCFSVKMSEPVIKEKVFKYFFPEDVDPDVYTKKVVVTGDEVSKGKPNPDIFLEAARRIGVSPEKCIVFEDSPHGVRGGKAAGCYTVALPDKRFLHVTGAMFDELQPTWTLPDGIASFLTEVVGKGGDKGEIYKAE